MTFGELLSGYRKKANLTLREFAQAVGYDSSNISKIERGVLAPPPAGLVLRKWASALGLGSESQECMDFISAGLAARIKRQTKTDAEIEALMPAFFRTVNNRRIDPAAYEELKAILRANM